MERHRIVAATLGDRLRTMEDNQPAAWAAVGGSARPNLHGMLRYPAMMVPCMQGDIIDAILDEVGTGGSRVVDPFVGSGTIMTEALLRGLDFTGVDINPLAVLTCEAKAAIDAGANVERAAVTTIQALRSDIVETVDVDFPWLSKWFDEPAARCLSRLRRSILAVPDQPARKVMWTVFAETIRVSSNSRTSTYKLHMRPEGDRVDPERIVANFEGALRQTLQRVRDYQALIAGRPESDPDIRILCDDVRRADIGTKDDRHRILVTSPPYGDNQTTIPYGQFSYLAVRWIPAEDLKGSDTLRSNTFALDTASLGGSLKTAKANGERIVGISPTLDRLVASAHSAGKGRGLRKVSNFVADLFDAFAQVRATTPGAAHWVITTGNRTAHGMPVALDEICRDIMCYLGGKPVAGLRRRLPGKRMPTRNSMGSLINTETTLVVEFA
ncbi:MAG: hypothetical protein COT28_21280 [Methylobacterium sp. CG08_land_8_20_14_0_20_71_15]|nr:MAG: hypothetical protein COT56_17835 [Methylobacterium sp. CG09_land_8_20_14_0_10_71_15]PIU11215.1 MAG: hypothetical protein COT28_21280 [Methylobacterium sp. CG08_land_8_20_14_0_20_71_15]